MSRRRGSGRAIASVVLAAGVLAGCASHHGGSSGAPDDTSGSPTHAQLVATARLDPCPNPGTTTAAASGGLPSLTLSCLGKGPAVNLADLRGKPTLINIWGSWCGPCQKESTYLASAYKTLRSKVRFLGIDIEDSDDSALDFDAHVSPPIRYPSVVDHDRKSLTALRLPPSPPVTLFVDAAGKVVHARHQNYTSTAAVRADISSYLHVA